MLWESDQCLTPSRCIWVQNIHFEYIQRSSYTSLRNCLNELTQDRLLNGSTVMKPTNLQASFYWVSLSNESEKKSECVRTSSTLFYISIRGMGLMQYIVSRLKIRFPIFESSFPSNVPNQMEFSILSILISTSFHATRFFNYEVRKHTKTHTKIAYSASHIHHIRFR